MRDRRNSLPPSKSCNHDKAHDHRCDDRRVGTALVGRVDDANEGQDNSRDDQGTSYIVETLNGLIPRNSLRMFWGLVEEEQRGKGNELGDQTTPVDVLPATRVDSIATDNGSDDDSDEYKTIAKAYIDITN